MKFGFKIFLSFFLLLGFGAYLFFTTFLQTLKPGFRQTTEESLVDVANILAEVAAPDLASGHIVDGNFARGVAAFGQRRFEADIWSFVKTDPSLQVYITDTQGKVVYDSGGKRLGADYSRWNDVYLTLRGRYGARSTLADPDDPLSSVMYVAAPVMQGGHMLGVLTVSKPNLSVQPFFVAAQRDLTQKAWLLFMTAAAAGLALSLWLSRSVQALAAYANAVRRGGEQPPPRVHGQELQQLAAAMAAMKAELDGKQYVERYVQTLTHQLKTPLASIIGAAELLHEDMPQTQRQRFIGNIQQEAGRMQQLVQRMLTLADIETRNGLQAAEPLDLRKLLGDTVQSFWQAIQQKCLQLQLPEDEPVPIVAERFLLQQALCNLLDNAIGFSPAAGSITVSIGIEARHVTLSVIDQGPGIPDYAMARLFERFYSLPRPGGNLKGTGLGLCFVKEIARLHGGEVRIGNRAEGGVCAALLLRRGS